MQNKTWSMKSDWYETPPTLHTVVVVHTLSLNMRTHIISVSGNNHYCYLGFGEIIILRASEKQLRAKCRSLLGGKCVHVSLQLCRIIVDYYFNNRHVSLSCWIKLCAGFPPYRCTGRVSTEILRGYEWNSSGFDFVRE